MKKNFKPENELLFLALGGSGEIGMNVNLYGCDGKWLMVDLGMTFGANEYPGIELVFADLEFIEERTKDLLGIVLTHAHEDHIGAVPYFAADLGVPLYATPFTAELVRRKLKEADLVDEVPLHIVREGDRDMQIGPFGIRYLPLAHSIAEGNALLIDTPYGKVFHTGDWKLDEDPIIGEPTTEEELRAIGEDGVLALVCDSTNVFNPNESGSEGAVFKGLLEEVQNWPDRRVVVTTFASNVARLHTLGEIAKETGRELVIAGRSLERILEVSQGCGYLTDFPQPIDWDTAMNLPRGKVLIVATGGQGEPRAALGRMADKNHPLELARGDVVLFSSRQIPGNEIAIGKIMNQLAERGIEMVTDRQSMIHVSGHPGRPELQALYEWLQPEVLVPVHGEIRHMQEQARLGLAEGIPHAVFQKNGDIVSLAPGEPGKIGRVPTGRLVLDGDLIVPADGSAVTERRRLSRDGVLVVVVTGRDDVTIRALGLPLDEDFPDFVAEATRDVKEALRRLRGRDAKDAGARQEAARLAARRAANRWSGKRPQVQVVIPEA
ncbi:RNA-metabolising metallo-beta-lactamase [Citromicrobium sp. RCC1885]|uniref:ribonuclease J n=1 Tax=unclassified Citromicrobium TaxID=2630544 RepID=UPI0006C8F491|nr:MULTISPECIES: ribonuclease J [unclassified Citromicrobium]KPM25360.1 RNA-metabolising metallo-beta-lactamase [Citromicrobium sp. RCC1885]KPM28601.1 RNA-metabolising metallo-beta-lactamase [Citromicrobium sp. RCC1878]OAM09857.1 MBL fold hydrolase [Citromicrobium sp. RCC1897]|tara:strand:+ start:218 stop:1867 length:1650 start_codon:yes stop_codon:yes gene_type:complete